MGDLVILDLCHEMDQLILLVSRSICSSDNIASRRWSRWRGIVSVSGSSRSRDNAGCDRRRSTRTYMTVAIQESLESLQRRNGFSLRCYENGAEEGREVEIRALR